MKPLAIGLTKRELFAAIAMQGILANVDDKALASAAKLYAQRGESVTSGNEIVARGAVKYADALLMELAK